ncbi:MAG: pilin [Patescibacteria group bacterium]
MRLKILAFLSFFLIISLGIGYLPVQRTNAFEKDKPVNVLDDVCLKAPDSLVCQENKKTQTPEDNSIYGPNGIFTKAAGLISLLVGIASVIMIIVGGFRYVMSSGDSNNITGAKNTILYAIIGLVVALVAQSIIVFVIKKV